MPQGEGLRDEPAQGVAQGVDPGNADGVKERGCAVGRLLGRLSVSPLDAPIPALSNRMTGRFAASPSVTAGSQ